MLPPSKAQAWLAHSIKTINRESGIVKGPLDNLLDNSRYTFYYELQQHEPVAKIYDRNKTMRFHSSLILLVLCVILSIFGCSSDTKPSQAEEKLFIEAYVKLTRAVQEHGNDPEALAEAQEAVFHEMEMDRERFTALAEKLEASPERWAVVWERIVEKLEKGKQEEGG
jgi:hypothetical protein